MVIVALCVDSTSVNLWSTPFWFKDVVMTTGSECFYIVFPTSCGIHSEEVKLQKTVPHTQTRTHIYIYIEMCCIILAQSYILIGKKKNNNLSENTSRCRQLRHSPTVVIVGVPSLHLSFATFEGRKYVETWSVICSITWSDLERDDSLTNEKPSGAPGLQVERSQSLHSIVTCLCSTMKCFCVSWFPWGTYLQVNMKLISHSV